MKVHLLGSTRLELQHNISNLEFEMNLRDGKFEKFIRETSLCLKAKMSSPLPLGDKLFQKAAQRTRPIDLKLFLAQIDLLTAQQRDHILLLLIHYYYVSGGTGDPFRSQKKSDLPYDLRMNSTGKGCSFDPNTLPPLLLNTLGEYLGI